MDGVENVFTIDANHMDMCKYSDQTADGYRKVAGELQELYENIRGAEQIRSGRQVVADEARMAQC